MSRLALTRALGAVIVWHLLLEAVVIAEPLLLMAAERVDEVKRWCCSRETSSGESEGKENMSQPTNPERTDGKHPRTGNRPIKKEIFAGLIGSLALVILYVAEQLGAEMPLEVALAIAGLIGGIAGYLKGE